MSGPQQGESGTANAAGSGPLSAVIRAPDLEIIEDSLAGLPLEAHRLSAVRGSTQMTAMQLPSMAVAVGEFRFPIVTAGETIADTAFLALPVEEGDGSWNGFSLDPRAIWAYEPGAEHYGVGRKTPPFAAVTLPLSEAMALGGFDDLDGARGSGGLSVHRGDSVARLGRFLLMAARWVDRKPLNEEQARYLERDLREYLVDALAGPIVDRPTRSAASQVVADCLAVVDELGPVPTMAELSAALDLSDRWIRAAFRKEHNLAPSEFLRTRRLNCARRDLIAGSLADTTVTEVAGRWGFWHLGRFSGQYRSLFGELPSATLVPDGPEGSRSDSG